MSILDDAKVQEFHRLIKSIGKAALNTLYPNDFENYLISLEIVNSLGKTVDFLSFPIMPTSLKEKEINPVSIQKTAGGIVTLNSSTYKPVSISLSGTFGRRFKFLLGRTLLDFTSVNFGIKEEGTFSREIKTGYGTTKVLKRIIDLSKITDEYDKPYQLYFYNQALGTSYIVKVEDSEFSQNVGDSNMMWNYNISLKSIAPLNAFTKSKLANSREGIVIKDIINKDLGFLTKKIKNVINV